MKRTLLTLALVAAAGTAGAQTVHDAARGRRHPVDHAVGRLPAASAAAQHRAQHGQCAGPANAAGSAGARARGSRPTATRTCRACNRGPDGSWRGQAMRGNTRVGVGVDARGNVTSE